MAGKDEAGDGAGGMRGRAERSSLPVIARRPLEESSTGDFAQTAACVARAEEAVRSALALKPEGMSRGRVLVFGSAIFLALLAFGPAHLTAANLAMADQIAETPPPLNPDTEFKTIPETVNPSGSPDTSTPDVSECIDLNSVRYEQIKRHGSNKCSVGNKWKPTLDWLLTFDGKSEAERAVSKGDRSGLTVCLVWEMQTSDRCLAGGELLFVEPCYIGPEPLKSYPMKNYRHLFDLDDVLERAGIMPNS